MLPIIDRAGVWALHKLNAETAHDLAITALKWGVAGTRPSADDEILLSQVWGKAFRNPIGLAAGFDKNCVALRGLTSLGFGFIEVGTVTPRPQPGNPKPRLFRLDEDRAIINRLGFNNDGLPAFVSRLSARTRDGGVVIGANVGANKDSPDRIEDYAEGARAVAPHADYIVVNVSSPNTPGLRSLQTLDNLTRIFDGVREARREAGAEGVPVVLKLAPDLDRNELHAICEFAVDRSVEGIVATNTTIERPAGLASRHRSETGGLSGAPLFERSTEVLTDIYRRTGGAIPIVGVGGIASAQDAYRKIRAGASLVQIYSALIFHGPGIVSEISRDLARLLREDGFTGLEQAVGIDSK